MKIYSISSYNSLIKPHTQKYVYNSVKSANKPSGDTVEFKGRAGKFLGGLLGGIAGGTAGGAIIGGGSLAGMALLAATGPIGWSLAAAYTVGGAIAGGYMGAALGDGPDDDEDEYEPRIRDPR